MCEVCWGSPDPGVHKKINVKPTCALCGATGKDGHPANYKGCPTYQNKLNSIMPKKTTVSQRIQPRQFAPAKPVSTSLSYAKATMPSASVSIKQNQQQPQQPQTEKQQKSKEPTLADLLTVMSSIKSDFNVLNTNINHLSQCVTSLEGHKSQQQPRSKQKQNG